MNTATLITQPRATMFQHASPPRLVDYVQRTIPQAEWTPADYLLQAHATVLLHQDYRAAARMLSHALRRYPDLAVAQRDLGSMKARMDEYQSARWYLSRYLTCVPHDALAFRMRGSVLGALGMYAGAVRDFDRTLALTPHDWIAYHYSANANHMCGRSLEARMDMLKAQELNVQGATLPENPWDISARYFAE